MWTGASVAIIVLLFYIGRKAYSVFASPLSRFPGPWYRAWSNVPNLVSKMKGGGPQNMARNFNRYGPIVRMGPNELVFRGSAAAWKDIHASKVGSYLCMPKDNRWYGIFTDLLTIPGSMLSADDENGKSTVVSIQEHCAVTMTRVI